MYSPTGRSPERWQDSRLQSHLHNYPHMWETLEKFWTADAHTTHPGGGKIYPPTGRAPQRQEFPRMPPHLHDFLPRGRPLAKFGTQPTHTIPHKGGSLAKFCTQGGGTPIPLQPEHTRGGGVAQPTAQGGGLEVRSWVHTPCLPPPLYPPRTPPPPPHLHLQGSGCQSHQSCTESHAVMES